MSWCSRSVRQWATEELQLLRDIWTLLKTSALVTSAERENMLTAKMWIPSPSLEEGRTGGAEVIKHPNPAVFALGGRDGGAGLTSS